MGLIAIVVLEVLDVLSAQEDPSLAKRLLELLPGDGAALRLVQVVQAPVQVLPLVLELALNLLRHTQLLLVESRMRLSS